MNHWPLVALNDIFEISRGGSPRPIDDFITDDPNGINWVLIGDASEGAKYITRTKKRIHKEGAQRSRRVKPGDFLLTNSMSFGRPYIMATSGCIHDGWLVLSPRRSDIHPDFMYYLLGSNALYGEFARLASGATVKNLNIDLVRGVKVPLPPLSEQRRIADILDKADALRAKRRATLAQLDALAQSIFLDMFGDGSSCAEAWLNTTLGEVADIVSGITKGRQLNGKSTRSVPYLSVLNVQERALDLSFVKTIDATDNEIERYRLVKDDLLLTEGGDADKLGRGTLWSGELPECIHQNHIFRVRLTNRAIDPLFLNWLVGSERGKRYFLRSAKQTTGIASINKGQLRAFPVTVPPLDVQRNFGRRIAAIERMKGSYRTSLNALNAIFAALQQRAFSGELTAAAESKAA